MMKTIMKAAVNTVYRLLGQREHDAAAYVKSLTLGQHSAHNWDDPEVETPHPDRPVPWR